MKRALLVLSLAFCTALTACAAPVSSTPVPQPTLTPPPPAQAPTATVTPDAQLITYHDPQGRFSFDYPKTWTLTPGAPGDRASGVQLQQGTPPAGSTMDVLVQLWDPKGDLDAFTAQRKSAWEGSLIKIVSSEDVTLAGGRPAKEFVVQGSDGAQGYFLLTTQGQDYLVASGSGDLAALRQIARSLR